VFVQPKELVAITLYVVLTLGVVTKIRGLLELLTVHVNVLPGLFTVKVTTPPMMLLHTDCVVIMLIEGEGATVICLTVLAVQEAEAQISV